MNLKSRVIQFGKHYLIPKGFSKVTPWAFEKSLDGLCQGVAFAKGVRHLQGSFTLDIYLRYMHNSLTASTRAMDCHFRIGEFNSGSDEWYRVDDDQSYAKVEKILSVCVEPFLQAHNSVGAVIRSFEEHKYGEHKLFGADPGWMHFNIGYCYLWIGNYAKAIEYLKTVVEVHSSEKYDWVQERKRIAEDGMERAMAEK